MQVNSRRVGETPPECGILGRLQMARVKRRGPTGPGPPGHGDGTHDVRLALAAVHDSDHLAPWRARWKPDHRLEGRPTLAAARGAPEGRTPCDWRHGREQHEAHSCRPPSQRAQGQASRCQSATPDAPEQPRRSGESRDEVGVRPRHGCRVQRLPHLPDALLWRERGDRRRIRSVGHRGESSSEP
jgi:hypothetical protein